MSDSEGSDGDVPPREVCEQRCQEFASITGTDTALAMFFLQDREWDLEKSVNAYFESHGGDSSSATSHQSAASSQVSVISLGNSATSEDSTDSSRVIKGEAAPEVKSEKDSEPHRIRLLSWNIDGLDTNNIKNRTKAVAKLIIKENPDVVYLQEVVPTSLEILEELCPLYQVIPGGNEGYFIAMMLRVTSVTYKEHKITQFYSSRMGRNLLSVQASVKGIDMTLMTSHLESTKEHDTERKKQLKAAFKLMKESEAANCVIFGGDLNLRDKEIGEIGGVPDQVYDLWEVTGKRPEAKFTWDLTRNDNLEWNARFRPRCRFDRLYLRHCKPARKLKPVYFEVVGIERIPSCNRFPSDHWGLLTHFDKV